MDFIEGFLFLIVVLCVMRIVIMLVNAPFSHTQAELEERVAQYHNWWMANTRPWIASFMGTLLFLWARIFGSDASLFSDD